MVSWSTSFLPHRSSSNIFLMGVCFWHYFLFNVIILIDKSNGSKRAAIPFFTFIAGKTLIKMKRQGSYSKCTWKLYTRLHSIPFYRNQSHIKVFVQRKRTFTLQIILNKLINLTDKTKPFFLSLWISSFIFLFK